MTFENWLKTFAFEEKTSLRDEQIESVLTLHKEGGTVPFIARYRKERTGNLDEVFIQKIIEGKEKYDQILGRQKFILEEIEKQGKLSADLKEKVSGAFTLEKLEDLYLPYKQKRKTKATLAKEAGLEPLANWIWDTAHGVSEPEEGQTLDIWGFTFRNEAKGFNELEAVLQGASDILTERLSESEVLREFVRTEYLDRGFVRSKKGEKVKPNSKFSNYFEYSEKIERLLEKGNSHRYLALRRGWIEEELVMNLGGKPATVQAGETTPVAPEDLFQAGLSKRFEGEALPMPGAPGEAILKKAAKLALSVYVVPSIENEVHKRLKDFADQEAIDVFSENVRKLLLGSPLGPKCVLGVDPGIRTGCKLAVVKQDGSFTTTEVIKLHSDDEREKAKMLIRAWIELYQIEVIAVGNGTAGRETEKFLRLALKDFEKTSIPVVMVNESGASVYSASEVAREEFPELDLTIRGAISIARRLQDPLAELVKIEPKSIGVGQYQHDVNQNALKRSLDYVVDSCVNAVGVNLNTASEYLLSHVSGIGAGLAKAIVEYRKSSGLFKTREQILEVPRFSKKTFEQAAGFIRVPESENPLDNTGVHPERYELLISFAAKHNRNIRDFVGVEGAKLLESATELRTQLGEFTFRDLIDELKKPGRDPRDPFVMFQFRDDIHEMKDVEVGMICPGIVTNVTNFGAFVDIGVHQDGLVHLSQLGFKFVKDPRELVNPGDKVQVKILAVDLEKKQLSFTMKLGEKREAPAAKREPRAKDARGPGRGRTPKPVPEKEKMQVSAVPMGPKIGASPKVPAGAMAGAVDGRDRDRERYSNDRRPSRESGPGRSSPAPQRDRHPSPVREAPPFNNPFANLSKEKK